MRIAANLPPTLKVLFAAAALLALTAAVAAAQEPKPVYKLHVDGLACPFCAYGIEKKLGAVEGVERIDIDIETGAMTVTMAEGVRLDEPTARAAVEAAGFSLRGFTRLKGSR